MSKKNPIPQRPSKTELPGHVSASHGISDIKLLPNSGMSITTQKSNSLLDQLFDRAGINQTQTSNQSWDELDGLYQVIGEAIVTTGEQVNLARLELIKRGVTHDPEIATVVRGIGRDLEVFTIELLAIREMHAGKSGAATSGGDIAAIIEIFNYYTVLQDRFRATTFPCMVSLTEALVHTENGGLTPEQDPNVITDVSIKDQPSAQ